MDPRGTNVTCSYCGKQRRLGDRWGAGVTDAQRRAFCTLECAWMQLLTDEAAQTLATATAAPVCAPRERAPRRSRRAPRPKRTRPAPPTPPGPHWNAMFGMGDAFAEP